MKNIQSVLYDPHVAAFFNKYNIKVFLYKYHVIII